MRKISLAFICVLCFVAVAFAGPTKETPFEVFGEHGMVSAAHILASEAGVKIMQSGGNAIDAAVATALALTVVEGNASGFGGGGFMVIRFAKTGEVVALDYREMAPISSTKDMFASDKSKEEKWSTLGGKAVGVPGWLKGMYYALTTYGTKSFSDVAAPAIKLAEEGFALHVRQNQFVTDAFEKLSKYNDSEKVAWFKEGLPAAGGDIIKQPGIAKAFKLVIEKGPDSFYGGEIGEAVVKAVNANGGNMVIDDLKGYKMHIRKPVEGTYRGYKIYSMPPSSSGGTHIVEFLNVMENFDVKSMGHNNPELLHIIAETQKMLYTDRAKYMADPDFTDVPIAGLTNKEYAKTIVERINKDKAVLEGIEAGDPSKWNDSKISARISDLPQGRISTSHFSVVDAEGNIVASTNTINDYFGCGVIVPEFDMLLNDEMDDFSSNPQSVNAPEPGKRPLSSMSPTIVLDPDGKPFIALGAAGGTRIMMAVAQVIMNVVDFGMNMDEAIEQARIVNFASGGKAQKLRIDEWMPEETVKELEAKGHIIERGGVATLQGIKFDPKTGKINGGADSRTLGVPAGY